MWLLKLSRLDMERHRKPSKALDMMQSSESKIECIVLEQLKGKRQGMVGDRKLHHLRSHKTEKGWR